ncbi:hypothetical protein ACU686_17200 [Yinghuangia aomiensis]
MKPPPETVHSSSPMTRERRTTEAPPGCLDPRADRGEGAVIGAGARGAAGPQCSGRRRRLPDVPPLTRRTWTVTGA